MSRWMRMLLTGIAVSGSLMMSGCIIVPGWHHHGYYYDQHRYGGDHDGYHDHD